MRKKHPYCGKSKSTNFPNTNLALQIRWKKSPFHEKIMGNNFPALSIRWVLLSFSALYGKLMGKPMHFACDKVYHRMAIKWKKEPILCEKYECQFPRFSQYDGFCRIFPGTNFPGFTHSMDLAAFSHDSKMMRKHIHFPCDEIYHRMGI